MWWHRGASRSVEVPPQFPSGGGLRDIQAGVSTPLLLTHLSVLMSVHRPGIRSDGATGTPVCAPSSAPCIHFVCLLHVCSLCLYIYHVCIFIACVSLACVHYRACWAGYGEGWAADVVHQESFQPWETCPLRPWGSWGGRRRGYSRRGRVDVLVTSTWPPAGDGDCPQEARGQNEVVVVGRMGSQGGHLAAWDASSVHAGATCSCPGPISALGAEWRCCCCLCLVLPRGIVNALSLCLFRPPERAPGSSRSVLPLPDSDLSVQYPLSADIRHSPEQVSRSSQSCGLRDVLFWNCWHHSTSSRPSNR